MTCNVTRLSSSNYQNLKEIRKCTQKLENIGFARVRELFKFKRSIIHYINEPRYLVGLILEQLFKVTLFITTNIRNINFLLSVCL